MFLKAFNEAGLLTTTLSSVFGKIDLSLFIESIATEAKGSFIVGLKTFREHCTYTAKKSSKSKKLDRIGYKKTFI